MATEIIRGLENLSSEDRLRERAYSAWRNLCGDRLVRIIEQLSLEGMAGSYLVQLSAQSRSKGFRCLLSLEEDFNLYFLCSNF